MKILMTPTDRIVEVENTGRGVVPARVWEGRTDAGVAVTVLVTRIAVLADDDRSQFEAELLACPDPQIHTDAWPTRLVL